jgi:hypothetical protein
MGGGGGSQPPQASIQKGATPGWMGPSSVYAFGEGGVVPGPIGAPQNAIVHGGETILPPGGLYSLIQALGGGRGSDTRGTV